LVSSLINILKVEKISYNNEGSMDLYDLPPVKISRKKKKLSILKKLKKRQAFWLAILVILASSVFGFLAGVVSICYFTPETREI